MAVELQVIAVDSRIDIAGRFNTSPKFEAQLSRDVVNKMGLADGDFIEIRGNRITSASLLPIDKDDFSSEIIGLDNLLRKNARVAPQEMVRIIKAEPKIANKIYLAPVGKHLKKSDLLEILAKKSFLGTPFVENDVTYLRSKIMRYLLGSITWLRVVKTDPQGIVVVANDTGFEILPDPVTLENDDDSELHETTFSIDGEIFEKDILDDAEWAKINFLIDLNVFNNQKEAVSFFIREGIKGHSNLFNKTLTVIDQIKQLKNTVQTY
ncbi:MAG: hypothetical protein ACXACH_01560 [Candidatus Hermodarchaeia archaeon]|jgi:hypothetical protein